jgi:hypothetical protein
MKKTRVYIDGKGDIIEGEVKNVQAYRTDDGEIFYGKDAKKRAEDHEKNLVFKQDKMRYHRSLLDILGIGPDHEEAEDEFMDLLENEAIVEGAGNINDCLNTITDFFSIVDDEAFEAMHEAYLKYNARRFSNNTKGWDWVDAGVVPASEI